MKLKQFIFALVAMLSGFAFTANAQVAKVGETKYATIDEAISNWTNGTTLTLLADVTLSDVVKIKSSESRTLDLSTFTMNAAKNKDAFQYEVTGSTSDVGLSIKADATNPGSINAPGKAIIRHTKPLLNAPAKDRPYTQFFGGVFNASYIVYQGGTFGTGYTGASAPRFVFHGGEFNGTIYANRSKFIFNGGTFNGNINISVDSSADALVKGGKFKDLSNQFRSDLNNDKFTIGSAAGVYDRGIYVDKDGYYVVTSEVIKEVSAKYPAVKKEDYNKDLNKDGVSDIYFYYSAANTYGMFYEVASMAGTGSNVEKYEHAEVVEELDNNAAVKDFTPELPSEVVTFEVEAIDIEATTEATTKVTFNVEPKDASGAKVSSPTAAITFRLPVPAAWSGKAKVSHNGAELGVYDINEENGAKYVEVSSSSFSEFSVEAIVPTDVKVATLAELQAALADNSNELPIIITETIVIPAGETVIIDLNGKTVTVPETTGKHIYALNNKGDLTLKDTKGNGSITARGIYNGYNGTSTDGTVDGAKMTIESGKYIGMDTDGGAAIFNCAELVVKGGDFTGGVAAINNRKEGVATITAGNYHGGNSYVIQNNGGQLTINDATVDSGFGAVGNYSGTTVINNGTYLPTGRANATCHVVYVAGAANVTINGGTFKMNYPEGSTPDSGSAVASYYKGTVEINGGSFTSHFDNVSPVELSEGATIKGGTYLTHSGAASNHTYIKNYLAEDAKLNENGTVVVVPVAAKIGETKYETLEAAFAAATEDQTIAMLADATPALTSQRAITKAAVIDLGGKTLTLTEDDLYFGTTKFQNGTIIVDPSVKPSTAVFWMFANQTLTFDNVKIVATGVTGTYLIGLEGENSDLNLLNGSEILVENTTALDLDIICVNGTNTCDIKVENSKVNVTNLDGRVFFRGNYTVKDSEVNLAGITKAGFRIEAGQTLSIEGTSKVNIEGEPRDGGIHITDLSATYTKAETATVNATVNEPKVAKVGENTYRTLAEAVAAVEDGGTITLIANETFTKNNRYNNGGWWDGLGYSGDKSFTIDLNGFTVSQDGSLNDYLFWFKNVGSKENIITIKNGTLDAGTTAFCALCTSSSHENKLTINTEKLNIINNISNGSTVKVRGGAVLNVNDGTVITGKNSYLGIECLASTVNIYDGAEIYMNGTSSYNGCLVGVCGGGTVNVYGGYGKGVKGGFIAMTSGGTINISGGEWIANTDGTVGNNSNLYVLTAQSNKYESGFVGASIINVTGGTLRGGMDAWVLNNLEGEKAELNIKGGNFNVNPARFVAEGYLAKEDNGVWTVVKAVAKVGETAYASLEEAFKAATEGCEIVILDNVTVDYAWDARKTGAKFTVPVTINGNGKTIKFTASVNDNNYQAPFRFEADATVKNLTIDMSEVTDNRFRAISSKGNLTVDGCKFIGKDESLNCRAIIFGEGAGANVGNLTVSITNSEFINWRRGITDNENAQDVKTVTITGNTLTDAGVGVSAKETVTFTGNTVAGAYVNIKSYTAGNKLAVTATGNTLEANTETAYNVIDAGGVVNAEGFNVVAKGGSMFGYTSTEGIYGEVWGNSRESFVIKVVDAQGNVMGTTSLNNVGGIIDGDVYVTWNIKFNAAANTDEYWTMAWTTAPSIDNMPAKVQLWVDGTNVSEGDVVLNGPDNLWPIAVAVTDAEGNILSCHGTIAAAVAANATNIALLRDTDEVIKLPLGVTLDKNGFTADGVTVTLPVAKIGEHNFASVNDALAYAKEAGLTNLEITIIGTNDASTTDSFDLVYTTLFDNVTIKQENGGVAYYIYDLYTGSRTNDGQFVFDGVNIVVTDQYMFEGNVKLSNNSLITSVAEANCFVYNAEVTVEAGSKIDGVIEDIRGGSLIIDGGKTDGTYCEEPALCDAILVVNWASSNLVLRNGAYVKVNAANEVGRLTVNGTMDVSDSKLESYEYIAVNSGATMNLNAGSVVTTKKVEGAGKITVDATGLEGTVTVINGDMAGFTGAIEVVGNDYAKYEITEAGLVINSSYIAELTLVDGEEFSNDSEKTVGKLTYSRTLPAAGIWYPVFLPFDVPVGALAENFDVARINDLHTNFSDEDGSIVKMWVEYIVKKSGTLAAGKPFLVRAKNSANLKMSIVLEEVKLYPASKKSTITVSSAITEVTFEGVYEVINSPVSTPSTRYMAVNADGVWDEFNTYSLNPFRVMMTLNILDEEYYINSTASLSVGSRVVGEENEDGTTTIYDVFVDRENDGTIYDLQGRKVLEITEPGIYIINGKKVLVK